MGRYVKGPPIRKRSLYDIYARNEHPEYRGGKPFDQYGDFIKKYQPDHPHKIERSPEAKPAHYEPMPEYKPEKKDESAEQQHLKSEADRQEHKQDPSIEQLRELYGTYTDVAMFKKREIRDRDGRIEGGPL